MHVMFLGFSAIAILVMTVVLFVFWLGVTILRGITRLLIGPGLRQPPRRRPMQSPAMRICVRPACRAINPVEARFCRRCGQDFNDPRHATESHAAIW